MARSSTRSRSTSLRIRRWTRTSEKVWNRGGRGIATAPTYLYVRPFPRLRAARRSRAAGDNVQRDRQKATAALLPRGEINFRPATFCCAAPLGCVRPAMSYCPSRAAWLLRGVASNRCTMFSTRHGGRYNFRGCEIDRSRYTDFGVLVGSRVTEISFEAFGGLFKG